MEGDEMQPKGEEETSSANYGSTSRGAATTEGTSPQDGGPSGSPPAEEEAPEKGAAAADDLRDLAAKGLCAPLWRTNRPLQPGMAEAEVHTLQTGWCRYAGQDAAKRTNVWLLTQSPRAMDLVASGQAVAGPPTPDTARPRLALPGDGFGADLPRAMSSPHQVPLRSLSEGMLREGSPLMGLGGDLGRLLGAAGGFKEGPQSPVSPFGQPPPEWLKADPDNVEQAMLQDLSQGAYVSGAALTGLVSSVSCPTGGGLLAELSRRQGQSQMDTDGWEGEATAVGGGWADRAPLAEAVNKAAMQLPERVMMALVQTPAMFAVPNCINKGFAPPFIVRVGVVSAVPTQIKATIAGYVLQKEQVSALERWNPGQHVVTESLSGAIVTQTIICHGPSHPKLPQPSPGKHTGVAEFVFNDLKFHSSSRMKPRWLVFALTLPTEDVLFVQYTVPTIIMSRQCDQHSKALYILRGQQPYRKRARLEGERSGGPDPVLSAGVPSAGGPGSPQGLSGGGAPLRQTLSAPAPLMDPAEDAHDGEWPLSGPFNFDRWRDMIERNCRHYALIRPFDKDDLRMLAKVAGFFSNQAACLVPFELSPGQWQAFGNWFMSYLRLFRCHQQLWMMRAPTAICGFGVDRSHAELLLSTQPSGTFLVRPSLSLAGTMVLSVVVDGVVKHMALDGNQLDTRSLEVWVRDVREAAELLDVASGQRVPKDQVFLLHYRRFGVVTDLGKAGHMFSAGGGGNGMPFPAGPPLVSPGIASPVSGA
ncbi:hypothetical protein WJX81_002131 [Elliptochloris bilobata]|uniref:SH2 domain-containing protein n=1 Tax=Elliptochloris bilobata TaxID=381761 RepID=A0AAW1S778_9CHLO